MVLNVLEEDHYEASYVKESPIRLKFLKCSNSNYYNIANSLYDLERATLSLWVSCVNTDMSHL